MKLCHAVIEIVVGGVQRFVNRRHCLSDLMTRLIELLLVEFERLFAIAAAVRFVPEGILTSG